MSIRFVVLFFLLFLLLSPVIRYIKIYIDDPIIILAQDNSESVSMLPKSGKSNQNPYQENINKLIAGLDKDYTLVGYLFGEKLKKGHSASLPDQETDFTPLFKEIDSKYTNYNVGALIIVSDGIYNKGANPVYGAQHLSFPVYTIALGDTTKKRDIIVKNAYSNKISFLGDLFPVEVLVNAYGYKDQSAKLKVYNLGKEIYSQDIEFTHQDYSNLLKFDLLADKKGLQSYLIEVEGKQDEFSIENNLQELIIEVLDVRKKILILSDAVHPDIGAIRKALETNKNISVESYTADEFSKPVAGYQLVVFNQLPSQQNNIQKITRQMQENQIPALYLIGQNTDINAINTLNIGVEIRSKKKLYEQAFPNLNPSFGLFETNADFKSYLDECQPLNVPFADYQLTGDQNVLMYQKIKGIATSLPLISLSQGMGSEKQKTGIIYGDGIWKWRMKDYMMHNNHKLFDEFINKLVNFLSLDVRKDRFMVYVNRIFKENEDIVFRAELYNPAYELVNSSEVSMVITDINKKEFKYEFSTSDKAYTLNAGRLPAGNYEYVATTEFNKTKFQKNGEFRIVQLNVEQQDMTANHNVLNQLSGFTGGKMYLPNEMDKLLADLKNDESIKKISHSLIDLIDLIEMKWLLFLLIFLLSIEWFIRKYFGAY